MVYDKSIKEIYYKLEQELSAIELIRTPEFADISKIDNIKRDKDIINIKNCMSYINIESFELFLRQAPKLVLKDIFIFHAAFTDIFESNRTFFHDNKLKKLFKDFNRLWHFNLDYGGYYNPGNEKYYSFDIPGDLFKDDESQHCFEMLSKANIKLSESFKKLLLYIRENYPEIDIDDLSRSALVSFNRD